MIRFLFECPVCQHQFRGKGGLIKCSFHIGKKHPNFVGAVPIDKSKEWVNGEWRDLIQYCENRGHK